MAKPKRHPRHHIDKKLRFRIRLYLIISVMLMTVVFYEILTGKVSITLAISGVCIGLIIGLIAARMFRLS